MTYERHESQDLDYALCSYNGSKLLFRGPKRELEGSYVACLGGTETYGKFIAHPFPELLERACGIKCVNFGWANAGVDAFLNDTGVLHAAQAARLVVMQVPCAQNMSNRFYTVHPRRNDRFLEATALLRQLYPDVDFTEFHFTRHLLGHLRNRSTTRFQTLRAELQIAWVSRMRLLLERIDRPVVLFWFSGRRPDTGELSPDVGMDPAFVNYEMLNELRPKVADLVEVVASRKAREKGTDGMVFSPLETPAAAELLGPLAHEEAAERLAPVVAHWAQ